MGVDGRETGGAGQVWCMGLYAHGKREATRDRAARSRARGAASLSLASRQRRGSNVDRDILFRDIYTTFAVFGDRAFDTYTASSE